MNIRETYNRIAEDWYKDHSVDTWWIPGTEKFCSFLQKGSRVLDVGCGGGYKSAYLVKKGLAVEGVDVSEGMIGIARREVPSAKFSVGDIRDLSIFRGVFDGVYAAAVILHIPRKEAERVIHGIVSTLKPGGYAYVAAKRTRPGLPDEEMKTESDYGYPYSRFFSYFSVEELCTMIERAGCRIVHSNVTEKLSGSDWIEVIAQKSDEDRDV